MSDETYYTVLNVNETASQSEIKNAYRDLIKQIHPDTTANLTPYLRRIAEDKTKEIIEAYTVLSNSGKRRNYDSQLAEYRRQNAPQAPSPPPSPPTQQATAVPSATPRQPSMGRRFGNNWAPLVRWARAHPILALAIPVFLVWVIAATVSGKHPVPSPQGSDNNASSQTDLNCPLSQRVEIRRDSH